MHDARGDTESERENNLEQDGPSENVFEEQIGTSWNR